MFAVVEFVMKSPTTPEKTMTSRRGGGEKRNARDGGFDDGLFTAVGVPRSHDDGKAGDEAGEDATAASAEAAVAATDSTEEDEALLSLLFERARLLFGGIL